MRPLRWLCGMSLLLLLSACGDVGKVTNSVDTAVAVIQNGINELGSESQNWQKVLQQVADQLPKDISNAIQGDVQNLVTRSIASGGIQFACSVDFLADRARSGLEAIKQALLHNTPVAQAAPTFCLPAPSELNLNLPQQSWASVLIGGYDMDHADASGHLVRFFTVDANGAQQEIPESRIGRTTHYAITLNLGAMAKDIYQRHVTKVVTSWNGQPQTTNQLVVISWIAQTQNAYVVASTTPPFIPPKVGHGDADFDVHTDRPMNVTVKAWITPTATTVDGHVFMSAVEPRPDNTEASGEAPPVILYQAPPGWTIVSVTPSQTAQATEKVTTTQLDKVPLQWGQTSQAVASQFDVWADHGGQEAGTWTRVAVHWAKMTVVIKPTAPDWAL